ncbi:MAG: tetratricopeptide repeat protein, partial [Xanthobacteraceae bacterium]
MRRILLSICAMTIAAVAPARAQTQQQIDWCEGDEVPSDLSIGGCTAVIQSGKFTGKKLAVAFYNRGIAYYYKKEYDRAIEDYSQAIRLDPKYAAAFVNRGIAYERKGQYDRAIENYSQVIRLDPKNAFAFNNRCWARAILGRELREALADCDASLRLRPNDAATLDSRGFVHIKLGQFDPAI